MPFISQTKRKINGVKGVFYNQQVEKSFKGVQKNPKKVFQN
jgi:hypothetical protein